MMLREEDGEDRVLLLEKARAAAPRAQPAPKRAKPPRGRSAPERAMSVYRHRHLLGIEPLEPADIEAMLDTAEGLREVLDRPIKKVPALRGKTVVNLFYEASTRTRASFEIAEKVLSADSLSIATATSSVAEGRDAARHRAQPGGHEPGHDRASATPSSGAPHFLARHCRSAIVNAGDGAHEHPTQALLDALTLRQKKGRLEGLRVAIVGDVLHSRVARSNVWLLTKMGAAGRALRAAHADAAGHRAPGPGDLPHRRGGGGRGRDHDAAHPAGAHDGRLLPVRCASTTCASASPRSACGARRRTC